MDSMKVLALDFTAVLLTCLAGHAALRTDVVLLSRA